VWFDRGGGGGEGGSDFLDPARWEGTSSFFVKTSGKGFACLGQLRGDWTGVRGGIQDSFKGVLFLLGDREEASDLSVLSGRTLRA